MDLNDVLYSVYFTQEWGSPSQENDKTFDPDFSPSAAQSAQTLVGIRPVSDHTVEVYVNYWHFDESEIASWAGMWPVVPWEIMYAMEQVVLDGKASFSRTDAQAKNLNWLSLIIPRDAAVIKETLDEFLVSKKNPPALSAFENSQQYYDTRYAAAANWIKEKNHAVISNGPFYLDNYSPDARTITIKAFNDDSYPFKAGYWSKFENVSFPKITKIDVPDKIIRGQTVTIPIQTSDTSHLYYFVNDATGDQVDSGLLPVQNDNVVLTLSDQLTNKMMLGGNDLKIYAISDSVLRPDIYTTSFLVVQSDSGNVSETVLTHNVSVTQKSENIGMISIAAGVLIIGIIVYVRRSRKLKANTTSL
jgi:peptide/nickel transport system substrate-binding protein